MNNTPDYDNEAMRQGRDLEAYVAERFCEETGLKVRKANAIYRNNEHPILLGNFDRLVVGEDAGLECKTVSPYSADKWAGTVPLHYQLQVQHYLAVSGYRKWYIAAVIFGQDFVIREIHRDEQMIADLIQIEEQFWNEYIVKGIMPEPDGSKSASELIAKKYFRSDYEKTIQLYGQEEQLQRREEISMLLEKLEKEKNAIDQKIKLQMEDAAYATAGNYRISWVTAQSQRIDTKRLKAEAPDVYDKFSKDSTCRRFMVKPAA